jgi:hypothetical protein
MTKNQTIDLLRNQLPGFYSVEQVINLIEKIEEERATTISSERIDMITRKIVETLEDEHSNNNLVNLDDIELDFNNWDRKITINDVPMDFNLIRDCIEQELIDALEEKEVEEVDEEND